MARCSAGWARPGARSTLLRLPGYVGGEPHQPVPRDVVAALVATGPEAGPAHWSVDFWTADLDAAVAEAERLGGRVVTRPHEAPPFRQAAVADPGRAILTLSQLVTAPA